ncbi:MAG: vWA domain-containing protein, partial [Candidatus Woesearchaeota archaeon]
MKKAIFYTMDALLASMLLIGAVALIYITHSPDDIDIEQQTFISQDILTVLSELKISELNNSFITQEIASGNITDINITALDQIGEYWALNKVDKAQILLQILINDSLPEKYGIKTSMGNNTLLLRNVTGKTNSVSFNRMISGIEQGRPITGSSGTSYLKKIRNKKTSSYAYFGGFVGQGNITVTLTLPSDFSSSRMINSKVKIDTPGVFELYINNVQCGSSYTGIPGQVSLWDISGCNDSFIAEKNNLSMIFISTLNTSYISGGFVKTTYATDTLMENITPGYFRYVFPNIEGFINLYDAIAVQGIITNWTLNLTYDSLYSTFFNMGNETIFIDPGQNTTRNIYISRMNLSIPPGTIPIRMTHTNLSNITLLDVGLPSDSFLVTDVSGSMDDCGEYGNRTMCRYQYKQQSWWWFWLTTTCPYNNISCSANECGISPIYSTRNYEIINQSVCTKTLLDIAKEADKMFVATILNVSTLHEVGLVDYSTNANTPTNLTNVESVLDSEIDSYTSGGSTCTCCGINYARNMINSSTDVKFMIVLSDGEPNYYCSNYNDYTGTSGSANISAEWAINASRLACQNNITVYSIGFGNSMTTEGHNIMRQIACNSSLDYNATNVSLLVDIYEDITDQILLAANFSSQTINILGAFNNTLLREGSYLDIYYEDINNIDTQSKLSLVMESEQFNGCNKIISIPPGISVQDAYMTSYSGNHWTSLLK